MRKISVVRKRIIPDEEILLSNDEFLPVEEGNSDLFMSKWLPLKPRKDIGWGLSLYDIKENYKISAIYDCRGEFLHWYCDIISSTFFVEENRYIIKDLLIDVLWDEISAPQLLDADELEYALSAGLITDKEYDAAIKTANKIVNMMKNSSFPPPAFNITDKTPPKAFCRHGLRQQQNN